MKANARLLFASGLLCAGLSLAPRAQADTLPVESLVQSSVLVSGTQSRLFEFDASGPGVLTVRLENISWPEQLARLDCSIYSNEGLIRAFSGAAEWRFETTGAASFYANVLAGAGGRLDLGLYSLYVSFQSHVAAVPVPAAAWLLASALGLFGLRRFVGARRHA